MKYKNILDPVTDGGKLMKLLRQYQTGLALRNESTEPKQVGEKLLWFDAENAKLARASQRATKLIAALWAQYCNAKR